MKVIVMWREIREEIVSVRGRKRRRRRSEDWKRDLAMQKDWMKNYKNSMIS
jgi:hypothetical protein